MVNYLLHDTSIVEKLHTQSMDIMTLKQRIRHTIYYFFSAVRDDENADNVGLSMIVFVTDELYQSEDFYWEYGNREPGIYIDKLD